MTEDLDDLLSLLLGASQEICSYVEQDIAKVGRHIENQLSQKCDNVLEFQSPGLPCEALQPARISRTLRKVAELGDRIRENRRARPRARSQKLANSASDALAETNAGQLEAQESEESKGIQLPQQAVQKAKGGLSRALSTCSTADTPSALGGAAGLAPSRLASTVSSSKPSFAQEPPRRPVGSRSGSNARSSITAGEGKTTRMSGRNVMDMVRQLEVKQPSRQSATAVSVAQLEKATTSSSVEDRSPLVTGPEVEAKLLADEHGRKESVAASNLPQGSVDEPVSPTATRLEISAAEASVPDVIADATIDQTVEICDTEARRSQQEICNSNALSGEEESTVPEVHTGTTKEITDSGLPEQPSVDAAASRAATSEVHILGSLSCLRVEIPASTTPETGHPALQPEEEPLENTTSADSGERGIPEGIAAPMSSSAMMCGTAEMALQALVAKNTDAEDADVPTAAAHSEAALASESLVSTVSVHAAAPCAPTLQKVPTGVPSKKGRRSAAFCMEIPLPTPMVAERPDEKAQVEVSTQCAAAPEHSSEPLRHDVANSMSTQCAAAPEHSSEPLRHDVASSMSTQCAAAPEHSSEPLCHDVANSISPPRRARDSAVEKGSPSKSFQAWQVLRQIKLPPPDPADNYEISDQADSDADENLLAERRSRKPKPRWCSDYTELLKKQADLDPDTIFGPMMPRCDLEEIFPDSMYQDVAKSRPTRRRGSSGNWRKDPLHRSEISAYKRKLGQNRAWVDLDSLPPGSHEALPTVFGRRALPTPARASLSNTFEV